MLSTFRILFMQLLSAVSPSLWFTRLLLTKEKPCRHNIYLYSFAFKLFGGIEAQNNSSGKAKFPAALHEASHLALFGCRVRQINTRLNSCCYLALLRNDKVAFTTVLLIG